VNPLTWIRDARQYLAEVQVEWKKITWPAQQEALAGTISVVVVVTIITVVLGFVDYGLSMVMQVVLQ
jgi:preprotein translocase subunit SecE